MAARICYCITLGMGLGLLAWALGYTFHLYQSAVDSIATD